MFNHYVKVLLLAVAANGVAANTDPPSWLPAKCTEDGN